MCAIMFTIVANSICMRTRFYSGVIGFVLTLTPLLPREWQSYTIHYRFRSSMYHIHINVIGPVTWNINKVLVDGKEETDLKIHLRDDHAEHNVNVEVG